MAREGKAKVLTSEELKRLLIVVSNSSFKIRNIAMLYVSFGLGLRAKEIAALTINDVADKNGKLLDVINLKSAMTKGNKQRHAYLVNKKVRQALHNHLDNLESSKPNKPLFQTQRKSKFTPNALQKWFTKAYKAAGIIGASSHSGRRTFITRLIEKGVDIKAVSRLAGHANIGTTAIYIEDNPERLKRIAEIAIV